MLKIRMVMRSFIVNTYKVDQMLLHGNVNEGGSIEQTGHKQVPIKYDKNLFEVVDESGRLLEEIIVDEGMVDLLRAIWRHEIPTNRSCQGGNGEMTWISFESFEGTGRFLDLVLHLIGEEWCLNSNKNKKIFEVSFPQDDIAKITEELNRQPVAQADVKEFLKFVHLNNE